VYTGFACPYVGCPGPLPAAPSEGKTVTREIEVGGRKRTYLLHIPEGLTRTSRPPSFSSSTAAAATPPGPSRLTRFSALADREKFLVVYPRAWAPTE